MKGKFCVGTIVLLVFAVVAAAARTTQTSAEHHKIVKATFVISGLHCSGCTDTIEASLRHVDGVHSIKVDWKTKKARIEFDEAVLPAQRVAKLVADTPHMMGDKMHYGAWLMLKIPAVKDTTTANQTKQTVGKVAGIQHVAAYPAEHSIAIEFPPKGEMTSQQLVDALAKVGVKAELL